MPVGEGRCLPIAHLCWPAGQLLSQTLASLVEPLACHVTVQVVPFSPLGHHNILCLSGFGALLIVLCFITRDDKCRRYPAVLES